MNAGVAQGGFGETRESTHGNFAVVKGSRSRGLLVGPVGGFVEDFARAKGFIEVSVTGSRSGRRVTALIVLFGRLNETGVLEILSQKGSFFGGDDGVPGASKSNGTDGGEIRKCATDEVDDVDDGEGDDEEESNIAGFAVGRTLVSEWRLD